MTHLDSTSVDSIHPADVCWRTTIPQAPSLFTPEWPTTPAMILSNLYDPACRRRFGMGDHAYGDISDLEVSDPTAVVRLLTQLLP
jgi:hypothetical protein